MLNVTRHRGNEYKSKPQWDIISHKSEWLKWTSQETTDVGRDAEEGNPLTLLMGLEAGTATLENSMEVPQKVENRATQRPSNCTTRDLYQRYKCNDLKGHLHHNVYSNFILRDQERERGSTSGRRSRGSGSSRLPTEQTAWSGWGSIPGPWNYDLSWRQALNGLSPQEPQYPTLDLILGMQWEDTFYKKGLRKNILDGNTCNIQLILDQHGFELHRSTRLTRRLWYCISVFSLPAVFPSNIFFSSLF